MFATTNEKLRAQPTWRNRRHRAIVAVLRDRGRKDEEHCLEAMLHWRDPAERSRMLRCRRHALVDDNPTSG
jgi:hypothetical protein